METRTPFLDCTMPYYASMRCKAPTKNTKKTPNVRAAELRPQTVRLSTASNELSRSLYHLPLRHASPRRATRGVARVRLPGHRCVRRGPRPPGADEVTVAWVRPAWHSVSLLDKLLINSRVCSDHMTNHMLFSGESIGYYHEPAFLCLAANSKS